MDGLASRYTTHWAAVDWLTQFGPDPDRGRYPRGWRGMLVFGDLWGEYDAPGWTANGTATAGTATTGMATTGIATTGNADDDGMNTSTPQMKHDGIQHGSDAAGPSSAPLSTAASTTALSTATPTTPRNATPTTTPIAPTTVQPDPIGADGFLFFKGWLNLVLGLRAMVGGRAQWGGDWPMANVGGASAVWSHGAVARHLAAQFNGNDGAGLH